MKIGIYGDVHLTKNMRGFQDLWDTTAKDSIFCMYSKFDEIRVSSAICLGDFFDAPRLEAKNMELILPILTMIDQRPYPTYILLGNHEIDSDESNILEFLNNYRNIRPITDITLIEDLLFLPYNIDPTLVNMKDKIVFTHHDIYGSELAGGKTKAFFGINPSVFDEATMVWNGHVHLKSIVVRDKIINAGSLLVSQQGELKLGEYPSYYILDTESFVYDTYCNKQSMIYLTIDEQESGTLMNLDYTKSHCVLKVEYEGEITNNFAGVASTSWRKKISSIDDDTMKEIHHSNFDMKNYISDYIKSDSEISDSDRLDYIDTGVKLLS